MEHTSLTSSHVPAERWKGIPGYEGSYRVSSLGRVCSLGRLVPSSRGRTRHTRERILKPTVTPEGYALVTLTRNGERWSVLVHRLVAHAFVPNPEGHAQVDHQDRDPSNNAASNLRWASPSMNRLNTGPKHVTSAYRGVGFYRRDGTWRARLKAPGGPTHLGYFATEIEAARAVDEAVVCRGLEHLVPRNFP